MSARLLFLTILVILCCFLSATQKAPVKTKCPAKPAKVCTLYATKLCVYLKTGKYYQVQSNPCLACQNKNVKYTSIGACPKSDIC